MGNGDKRVLLRGFPALTQLFESCLLVIAA